MKHKLEMKETEFGMIPSDWEVQELKENADVNMGQSPASEYYTTNKEDIPFLQGVRTFGLIYPTFDTYCSKPTKIANYGEILFSVRAPVGDLNIANTNICIGRGIASINSKYDNNTFLFYLLKHYNKQILNLGNGSVFSSINKKEIENLKLAFPPLQEQKAIAKILSDLDEKIEINRKINENLEELGQTLFKRWFIDFEFPNEQGEPYSSSGGEMIESELGDIPKGWKIKELSKVVNVKRGGSPRPIKDFMELRTKGLHWVKISDATASLGPFITDTKEFIKKEGLNKTVFLKKGELILSNSATPGIPKFLDIDACIHDGWLFFPNLNDVSYYYLYYYFLKIRLELIQQGNGSVFTNLKTDILKKSLVIIPSKKIFEKINNVFVEIFNNILNNTHKINNLQQIRDSLLPKLMSGQIRVN